MTYIPPLNKDNFREKVELLVVRESMTYVDAIVALCDEYDIEYEDVVSIIPAPMIAKLEAEARAMNILPKAVDITAFFS